jgi:hypothetical protein
MGYYTDLATICIDDYQAKLEIGRFAAHAVCCLKERLAERFGLL